MYASKFWPIGIQGNLFTSTQMGWFSSSRLYVLAFLQHSKSSLVYSHWFQHRTRRLVSHRGISYLMKHYQLLQFCTDLVIIINWEKSDHDPMTRAYYLGMTVDTMWERVYPADSCTTRFRKVMAVCFTPCFTSLVMTTSFGPHGFSGVL